MNQENVSGGYSNYNEQSPDATISKTEQIKNQPEKMAENSYYSSSTIQKSNTESLVLALASGFPVLQPPPKTQAKNQYEATSVSVGGVVNVGSNIASSQTITQVPLYTEQTEKDADLIGDPAITLDDVIKLVKNVLAILTHNPNESDQLSQGNAAHQLDKMILSAMALSLLYRSVYGEMTEQEFYSLFTGGAANTPEQVKGLFEQLSGFIKANLPSEPKTREEIITTLMTFIDKSKPLAETLETIHIFSQKITKNVSLQNLDDIPTESLANLQKTSQVQEAKNSIINSMGDTYNKNLTEFSTRMKGEDISQWLQDLNVRGAKSPTEYYASILALSSTQIGTSGNNSLIEKFNQTFNHWINQPNQSLSNLKGSANLLEVYPSSSFIAGCVVCGADVVSNATSNTSSVKGLQSPESPVADILFAVGPTAELTVDYQAAAALIAALLSNGAAYKATDDELKKNKGSPPRDIDFAINYARNIIAIVTYKGERPLSKEIEEQNRLIRLMLSTMALNLLYRAAYGGMTGEEFASVLKGETGDIPEKIKPLIEQLAYLIKANLSKNEKVRTETIIKLMEYVDTKDSIDSMLQSTRVLSSLLPTREMEQKRWEVQSG